MFLSRATWHAVLGVISGLCLLGPAAPALELRPVRSAGTDLEVSGLLAGLAPGEKGFLSWADLATLPTTKLLLPGEFLPGPQEVTVVFLADLWRALPPAAGADTLLAVCKDGYASVYTEDFIARDRPFLILAINGAGPEHWPPPGLAFNPGPYVISVSASVVPAVADLLDAGHKKPWGVVSLQWVHRETAFAGFYEGVRRTLSPQAQTGREIWINSCASCHRGPAGTFGGTKSDRPFAVLVAYATAAPDYFKNYVRHPTAMSPAARMEAHPHYTDAQLEALLAFLSAGAPR